MMTREEMADFFDAKLYALVQEAEEIGGSPAEQPSEHRWCDRWCSIASDLEAVRSKVREMMSAEDRELPQEPLR